MRTVSDSSINTEGPTWGTVLYMNTTCCLREQLAEWEWSGHDTVLVSDEICVISRYREPFLTLSNLYNSRTQPIWDLLFWSRIIKFVLIHYLLFKFFFVSPEGIQLIAVRGESTFWIICMKLSIIKKLKTESHQDRKETEISSCQITFRILLSLFTVERGQLQKPTKIADFCAASMRGESTTVVCATLLINNSGRVCLVGVKINLLFWKCVCWLFSLIHRSLTITQGLRTLHFFNFLSTW